MIIFPAIDLKNGKAVRLKQGKANEQSIFSEDPISMALHWQALGAEFLHLIDLDGAFSGESRNAELVKEICQQLSIPVQLGGGIRSEEVADFWINTGVNRLIIGTLALENTALFEKICHKHQGRIGVSLDAENKILKSRGWVENTGVTIHEMIPQVEKAGAAFIIYTDIERDGMHSELNKEDITELCQLSTIPFIAAGGVSTMKSVIDLYPLSLTSSLEGIISGRAIYEGTLDLAEAMDWINSQKNTE